MLGNVQPVYVGSCDFCFSVVAFSLSLSVQFAVAVQCRDDVHHSFTVRLSASLFTVARCLLTAMMALAQPRRRRRRRRLGWFGSCV